MQRWTPIAGCVGQAEGTHVTWADHCAEIERLKQVRCEGCGYLVSEREHLGCKSEKTLKDLERLTTERDNAEKREYEVLGRANALEAELKATQARLVASDELLREEFAQRQDHGNYVRHLKETAYKMARESMRVKQVLAERDGYLEALQIVRFEEGRDGVNVVVANVKYTPK